MKKSIVLMALVLSGFFYNLARAQVNVSVNIGVQPVWGPVGYDHVDYYYIPDVDAYYDVPSHVFVYYDGGAWVRRPALPPRYGGFDLYHGYKVVINERDPWLRHEVIRTQYATYRGRHDQVVIRDSHEPRYFQIKEHPEHNKWKGDEHHDNGGGHKGNAGGHKGEGHKH